ncbi:MAG: UDP-N-acetylglucosamine 2-epimerase (non-hydrolyzing) [Elusimicrobia bacterium]|nr:UDP-N-acetylglucosamine 2-epimerase (non-hydrolyzing) [Elusimicrobiota bacterium]
MKAAKKIILVAGARPNFMKVYPVYKALAKNGKFKPVLVHTGQHYDSNMSGNFFKDFGLPAPDIYLGVGSASHAVQTARIMMEFEKVCLDEKPDIVVVVGDVNSTLACSLTASKLLIPIAHIESGLRSFDREMPEEINRLITDAISDYLFVTCMDGKRNLLNEGIPGKKIFFVGNTMIDTLKTFKPRIGNSGYWKKYGKEYALLTLHRPSNVDGRKTFIGILKALDVIQKRIKIVFPVHPRTMNSMSNPEIKKKIKKMDNLILTGPLGYMDFMSLVMNAKLVLTDSGGIQEETTVLGVPCLTLRRNTERPVTITEGTNILVGDDPDRIAREAVRIMEGRKKKGRIPRYWDGKTADRIVKVLEERL